MSRKKMQKNLFNATLGEGSRTANRHSQYKCMINFDDEQYYCYKKVQGRWTMCNAVPYATREECEMALEKMV